MICGTCTTAAEAALAEELGERPLDDATVTAYWMAAPEPYLLFAGAFLIRSAAFSFATSSA